MATLPLQHSFNKCPIYTHESASVKLSISWDVVHEVTVMVPRLYWNVNKYYNLSIEREKMKKNINKVQFGVH